VKNRKPIVANTGPNTLSRRKGRKGQPEALTKILYQLADQCEKPELLIELYYWSREPDLAKVMRGFIQLTETSQKLLSAFLDMVKDDPDSVQVAVGQHGEITLSSSLVSELFQKLTATEQALDKTSSLH
jgi:hypothetical protein